MGALAPVPAQCEPLEGGKRAVTEPGIRQGTLQSAVGESRVKRRKLALALQGHPRRELIERGEGASAVLGITNGYSCTGVRGHTVKRPSVKQEKDSAGSLLAPGWQ